jgi:hypothetical protein
MIFEYIKTGWQTYKSNFMGFIIAELIALIIVITIIGIGTGIIFTTIGISSFAELRSPELTITRIVSIFPLFLGLSTSLVFYLIAVLLGALFATGLFYMAAEALRGSTDFKSMFTAAKEIGVTGVLASIIILLIALILMFVFVAVLGVIFPVIGSVVGAVLLLLIMVLFSLTHPGIVIDDIGPIEAIERSINVTKKNYSDVFALLVFYVGISLALTFIPFIGQIIIYFVIIPMCFISLVFFYKRNRI